MIVMDLKQEQSPRIFPGSWIDDTVQCVYEVCGVKLDIICHRELESTNDWSMQECVLRPLPFACLAEMQTAGKGRRGKAWEMDSAGNLALSLCWQFESIESLKLLPLGVAVSIARLLDIYGLQNVAVKWPNDVYVNHRKIAGVLIETRRLQGKEDLTGNMVPLAVVAGVGFNYKLLNNSARNSASELLENATDFITQANAAGVETPNLQQVAQQLISRLCQHLVLGPNKLIETFTQRYDYCQGRQVDVLLDSGECLTGVALGINNDAQLLVDVGGKQMKFNSAEVSVRAM